VSGIGLINPLLLADGLFSDMEMRAFRPRIARLPTLKFVYTDCGEGIP
jgi:hypothetical protein